MKRSKNGWVEKNVADYFSQSAPGNVTSEMGLAMLDLADVIRPHKQVLTYLYKTKDERFLEQLDRFEGGAAVRVAINNFLEQYGMRCVGEIDITRPRWAEQPLALLPMILNNVRNFKAGEAQRRFESGKRVASLKEEQLVSSILVLPDGERKAAELKRIIKLHRNVIGYREYPKYALVKRYFIYKMALLNEARTIFEQGIINDVSDIFYLSLEELSEVFKNNTISQTLIHERRIAFDANQRLIPPRVITSEGEVVAGSYNRTNIPAGAIVGLGVSAGTVEGRARVIKSLETAVMKDGDILVTTYTDPSWTPLFLSIKALITEVGGLMTHGAVVAREYGLPAVAGVENAGTLIRDGQRIRVNGTTGVIELLE